MLVHCMMGVKDELYHAMLDVACSPKHEKLSSPLEKTMIGTAQMSLDLGVLTKR